MRIDSKAVYPLVSVFALAMGSPCQSDWPKFRGAHGDGVAASQPVSKAWGEKGPPESWRRQFGTGLSSVAAVGDRLYTMGAPGDVEEAFCLDAKTGKTIWRVPLGPRFDDQFGNGPRATPTVDGDLVFAVSSTMHLAAIGVADGKVRWEKKLLEEYKLPQPRFGFASSVVVAGGNAILEVGAGKGKGVVAFARATGQVAWTALDGRGSKSTPLLVELHGVPQLIFNRPTKLSALSLDGKVLWTHEAGRDVIVMAQFVPPNLVVTSSAYMGKGAAAVRVTKSGDEFATEQVWMNRRFRNHFNNSVLVNDHLFGFDNSTLRCIHAKSGKLAWSKRGFGKGSLIACGDVLYVLGDQGILALVAAEAGGYRELGRVQSARNDELRCWTSPSLAAGRLYVRNLEEIVAYDVSAPAAAPVVAVGSDAATQPEKPTTASDDLRLDEVLRGYTKARGGLEQWRRAKTLAMDGTFTAFSRSGPFSLRRSRGNLYCVEFDSNGKRDARARGREGLWWRFHLFRVNEPARVKLDAYHRQMKRESMFEPALLDAKKKGIDVKLLGRGKVDAVSTIDLELTFPDGAKEQWRLHAETFREVAVDSVIVDMTQAREPMKRRTFYSDFRTVGGLVFPFKLAMEFGARLEEIEVAKVTVNPELDAAAFDMPRKKG